MNEMKLSLCVCVRGKADVDKASLGRIESDRDGGPERGCLV